MTAYVAPEIEHSDWDRIEDRVKLFAITRPATEADVEAHAAEEGEWVEEGQPFTKWYTMPGKPHVGLGLAFIRNARMWGLEVAMGWLLEEAVGTEGYLALAAEPDLDPADLAKITAKCREVVMGGLEVPKG